MLYVLIAFNFNYNPIKLDDYLEGHFQFYCVPTIKYASGTKTKKKQEKEEENEIGNLINELKDFTRQCAYTHAHKNIQSNQNRHSN